MSRVLVTGGAGLVGRSVVRRLAAEGFEVVVLDARQANTNALASQWVPGRTADPEAIAQAIDGCDAVVHLEWNRGVRDASSDALGAHDGSVTPSLRLLESCRRIGARFVFSSTLPYRGEGMAPQPEDAPVSTRSIYAIQKLYVEQMAQAYASMFGLPTISLRLANVYGEGGREYLIVNRILDCLRNDQPLTVSGDGLQARDFVHADDVAEGVLLALRAPDPGGAIVNIGTGHGVPILELVHIVEELAGREVRVIHGPAQAMESRYLVPDCRKARELLGWSPKIELREGLRPLVKTEES